MTFPNYPLPVERTDATTRRHLHAIDHNRLAVAVNNLSDQFDDQLVQAQLVVRVTRAAAGQNISNGANPPTAVIFDTEVFDPDGWHEGVTNPSRLTCPSVTAIGLYAVRAAVLWPNSSVTGPTMHLRKNNTNSLHRVLGQSAFASAITEFQFVPVSFEAAGDYIDIGVTHNTGLAINLQTNTTATALQPVLPFFELYRLMLTKPV